MFVKEGISEPQPVGSMPGVVQHTRDSLRKAAAEAAAPGSADWSCSGSRRSRTPGARRPTTRPGSSSSRSRDLAAEVGDATVLMADLCLDEYTDHGHCGC